MRKREYLLRVRTARARYAERENVPEQERGSVSEC